MEEKNKIQNNEINDERNLIKNNKQKKPFNEENINKDKYYFNTYQRFQIIKYFIINILLCQFYSTNSLFNSDSNNIFNSFSSYSYIITLKVKGTGRQNILSYSTSLAHYHVYQCPSSIYINDELIQNTDNCHYINIDEPDSEIKLEWNNNNIINSVNGMFYNCKDITEIDMTKFDTSSVTDMKEMFSNCESLKYLDVSNLDTRNVSTFEYMFFNCINLTSLNLESFTNPSAISLYRMFYGCINLEYINIKNFEEKENMNLYEMFYNIQSNAVVCFLSCSAPTNFTISSITTSEITISWEGYELNKFIISYGLQNFAEPDEGDKVIVLNTENYTFTNLNPNEKYDVYIKTDCDSKSSWWIGPLLISFEFYNMAHNGINNITTCSKVIYDSGGPNGAYLDYANSTLIIYPEISGKLISIKGKIDTERCCDHLYIYDGVGTNGILLGKYNGLNSIPLYVSISGPLTIKFISDYSIIYSGFELIVDCVVNSNTIYYAIKNNQCRSVLCNDDWRNMKNIILPNSGLCIKNCNSTSAKYYYQGQCYNNCPENTINHNNICYSNSINEKCGIYSFESNYFNLCIKCKNGYYPKYNDINNIYNYIDCYENNSLIKYYLDNDDFLFKPCYQRCETCNQKGTYENHKCITCESYFEINVSFSDYYNCYSKCLYYYYLDKNKIYRCSYEKECPKNYSYLIEEKNQCIDDCSNDNEYNYYFRKKCYKNCPVELSYESDTKNNFCEVRCNKEMPLEIVEYQNCTNFCGIDEMNNKSCISKYQDTDTNGNIILQNILQDITSSNFNSSILNNNKNIIINESFITFIITNYKNQENLGNIKIDLGACENKLIEYYSISNEEDLIIFAINIDKKEEQIKKLIYEVYSITNENKLQKLDLKICKDAIINSEKLSENNYIIKCSKYSIDSILDNSCIGCKEPYYPIYEEFLEKNFFKCYQNIDGYYLDNNQYFKKCYESCALCETEGNITHHNCIKCNSDYFYELNISSYLNCYKECKFNFYYDEKEEKFHCTPNDNCVNYYDKIISEEKQCVHTCEQNANYPFEFQKKCYNSCPENISEISEEKINYCEIKCPKDLPYELIEMQKCVKNCTFIQISNKICKLNFKSENKNEEYEAQENLIQNIQFEITENFDTSFLNTEKEIVIQEPKFTITITKNDEQKNGINSKTNTTTIDLGECETKVKNHYNISENETLYVMKMDVAQDGYKIPKIQYEVYYPLNGDSKLVKLNLTVCDDTKVNIFIPLTLERNLEIYNPKSPFYYDICYLYEEDGKDIPISLRKRYFINNKLSLCEENCDLVGYNKSIEKVNCSCMAKTNFEVKMFENEIKEEDILELFMDFNNILNIKVLTCVNSIFTVKAFKENYANIILIVIILLYLICLILFISKGYNNEIKFYIDAILYFTLFKIKISYIIKKKQKEEENLNSYVIKNNNNDINNNITNNINNNIINNINKNIKTTINFKGFKKKKRRKIKIIKESENIKKPNCIIIKPPIYNYFIKYIKNSEAKNDISNPNKKKGNSKISKRKNKKKKLADKIKLEEESNEKLIEYNEDIKSFQNFSEIQIYELHKKIYTKTDKELNDLPYASALKYDKRTYLTFYFSLVKSNHLLFFSFLPKFDFNSRILKMYLFFFNFATFFFVNTLFYTDETIARGFDFIHDLPSIIYSTIISAVINQIINLLTITESSFITYRNESKKENVLQLASDLKRNFKIKFTIFFILDFLFLGFYWIYLSCFMAVYRNTRMAVIKDTFISFGTSFISPFGLYLLPGIFRIPSLKNKNRKALYIINQILQLI